MFASGGFSLHADTLPSGRTSIVNVPDAHAHALLPEASDR
jgi:hypothetical protein